MPRSASPEARYSSSSKQREKEYRRREERRYRDEEDELSRKHSSRRDDDFARRRMYDDASNSKRSRRHEEVGHKGSARGEEERRKGGERRDRKDDDTDERSHSERHRHHRRHKHHRSERASSRHLDDEREAEKRAKAAETLLYATETDPLDESRAGAAGSLRETGGAFQWAKKAEKERKMGITAAEARRRDEDRRREAEEEIARLNQKREEREREQAIREEEEARMARLQESEAMAEWVAKEDDFYLEQSRKRAVIRVREDRAKPIDLLAINLKWVGATPSHTRSNGSIGEGSNGDNHEHPAEIRAHQNDEDDEDDLEIDLEEPYLLFDNLALKETEELHQDIQMYLSLEKREQNLDFWRSMLVVCDDKLSDLRLAAGESLNEAGVRLRIDPSVKKDMNKMLSSKTHEELIALQDRVRQKLGSGEPVDVEYWEGLLKAIVVWRAKAKLRDMHEVILSNRIEHLRHRQHIEAERRTRLGLPSIEEEKAAKAAEAARKRADWKAQQEHKQSTIDEGSEDLFENEAAKALEEGEEVFASMEEDLSALQQGASHYSWEDKYRPRKPKYFNKVHTGYEWNKYNQTHYDVDNPPPKQVQGYKFNIFYPDLIDPSTPPTYRIVKEKGNDETCLIIFEAGPPYETIGFRIVNKPWNMSHQRGFRAVFERGILQLYFSFQRMFYRK